MVGLPVEPVAQDALLPTVQGTSVIGVGEVMQRPWQVSVWVQIALVGQGSPARMQGDRAGLGFVTVVGSIARSTTSPGVTGVWYESTSRLRDCMTVLLGTK